MDKPDGIEPQSVSPVPASIPDAWESVQYDDGYPEDEQFSTFDGVALDFYRAARWLLEELPRAADNMCCFCEVSDGLDGFDKRPVKVIRFSTGGWSGAESLIGLVERRFDMSHFMLSWRRGGHYVFEISQRFLEHRSMDEAKAQGMETRQGGDGTAPSQSDDSPVRQDAPETPPGDTP